MYKNVTTIISLAVLLLFGGSCRLDKYPILTGDYLGQTLPEDEPELFAPGIVSTGMYTRDITMMPDGSEIYFGVSLANYTYAFILETRLVKGKWTYPEIAPFSTNAEFLNFEPFISPDGKQFFFVSNRPVNKMNGKNGSSNIWVMDRIGNNWSEPYCLEAPVNTEHEEYFPSVTKTGTLYFTRALKSERIHRIYRSKLSDGKYTQPEKLPEQVNSGTSQFNAFIAPNESYIIVPVFGRKDSYGSTDYYISFRNRKDQWSRPVNLGDKVNTEKGEEYSPYVSPDGKYFFFMSTRMRDRQVVASKKMTYSRLKKMYYWSQNGNADIYWMDAAFIQKLRPKGF